MTCRPRRVLNFAGVGYVLGSPDCSGQLTAVEADFTFDDGTVISTKVSIEYLKVVAEMHEWSRDNDPSHLCEADARRDQSKPVPKPPSYKGDWQHPQPEEASPQKIPT